MHIRCVHSCTDRRHGQLWGVYLDRLCLSLWDFRPASQTVCSVEVGSGGDRVRRLCILRKELSTPLHGELRLFFLNLSAVIIMMHCRLSPLTLKLTLSGVTLYYHAVLFPYSVQGAGFHCPPFSARTPVLSALFQRAHPLP